LLFEPLADGGAPGNGVDVDDDEGVAPGIPLFGDPAVMPVGIGPVLLGGVCVPPPPPPSVGWNVSLPDKPSPPLPLGIGLPLGGRLPPPSGGVSPLCCRTVEDTFSAIVDPRPLSVFVSVGRLVVR